MGCKWPTRSGRRTAILMRQPPLASARTTYRPTKPEPPKIVTSFEGFRSIVLPSRVSGMG